MERLLDRVLVDSIQQKYSSKAKRCTLHLIYIDASTYMYTYIHIHKCIHTRTHAANLHVVGLVTHHCTMMWLMAAPITLAYIWQSLGYIAI